MSLHEQVQRVDGGQNAALKKFIEKLGGTVPGTTKIDGYADIIDAMTIYSAVQQLANDTKTKFSLGSTATPDDVLDKLSKALLYTSGNTFLPDGTSVPYVKIVTGSYVGTGMFGAENPNSLTFDFPPQLVCVLYGIHSGSFTRGAFIAGGDGNIWAMLSSMLTTEPKQSTGFCNANGANDADLNLYGWKSSDGKTFYWYNTYGALQQCNQDEYTYYWIAFL